MSFADCPEPAHYFSSRAEYQPARQPRILAAINANLTDQTMPRLIDYQSPGSPPQGYPLPARLIRRIAVPLASLLVVFVIVSNSYYTVDVGYVAVITRNGRIATVTTAGSGLGWMVPFISSVHKFSVQSQAVVYDQMQSYSLDQQPAYFKVSLRYHVSPGDVEDVYTQYGTEDSMVCQASRPHCATAGQDSLRSIYGGDGNS